MRSDARVVAKCQSDLALTSFGPDFSIRFNVRDGNCQFHAVLDQLSRFIIDRPPTHTELLAKVKHWPRIHTELQDWPRTYTQLCS
jgi:hypothetical protein